MVSGREGLSCLALSLPILWRGCPWAGRQAAGSGGEAVCLSLPPPTMLHALHGWVVLWRAAARCLHFCGQLVVAGSVAYYFIPFLSCLPTTIHTGFSLHCRFLYTCTHQEHLTYLPSLPFPLLFPFLPLPCLYLPHQGLGECGSGGLGGGGLGMVGTAAFCHSLALCLLCIFVLGDFWWRQGSGVAWQWTCTAVPCILAR